MPLLSGAQIMYERFTDRARKVMKLANQEARRFNHEYIGTEHLLLALLAEGTGVAANTLRNLDLDLRKIRSEIEKIIQPGTHRPMAMAKLPQTPRVKKVFEYSIEEARSLNHNYIGTEHLLLGLLREQEAVAAQVLVNLGLKLEEVRAEVGRLLGCTTSSSSRKNRRSNGFELVARRAGLWIRKHQIACIFAGGLLSTLAGGLVGVNFAGPEHVNKGALIAGSAYVLAVAATCLASGARKRIGS
jgi:ATP-dependent Clp protease ATP-binding subunit ClpA